jgi:hemoglobin
VNAARDAAERRARATAEIVARTGIGAAMIEGLMRHFYGKVREDPLIGPVFAAKVTDWESHLQRIFAFWSSVALMSGDYRGNPMGLHLPLPIDHEHFDRWLALFEASTREVCPPAAAEHFLERAHRIAQSLEMGIAAGQGVLLGKEERFRRDAPP